MLNAKLTVFTGSMFASKSSALISQGERHSIAGRKVIYCKPEQDTRYSETSIITHNGDTVGAITIPDFSLMLDVLTCVKVFEADVILIDEAQFFGASLVHNVKRLLERGKVVYVAGLDMDHSGKPFETTARLMALADEVTKLKAVCSVCGEDSYISAKTGGTDERIELGSKELYKPMCRSCYKEYEEGNLV